MSKDPNSFEKPSFSTNHFSEFKNKNSLGNKLKRMTLLTLFLFNSSKWRQFWVLVKNLSEYSTLQKKT